MSCERFTEAIADLVDDAIDDATRAALDAHLTVCANCRSLVDDLQRIRQATAALEPMTPPESVWDRIAATLRSREPAGAADTSMRIVNGASSAPRRWLAAVAVLVLVVGAGGAWLILSGDGLPENPSEAEIARDIGGAPGDQVALIASVEADLRLAEEYYDRAMAGLEQVATSQDGTLDPQVGATLEKNLDVIDQAIAESQAALHAEPESQVAQDSLFEVMWRKVSLLQDTIALVNEMRKGNQAEAARIVEGLNRP